MTKPIDWLHWHTTRARDIGVVSDPSYAEASEEVVAADRQWFVDHPERACRVRLVTAVEQRIGDGATHVIVVQIFQGFRYRFQVALTNTQTLESKPDWEIWQELRGFIRRAQPKHWKMFCETARAARKLAGLDGSRLIYDPRYDR